MTSRRLGRRTLLSKAGTAVAGGGLAAVAGCLGENSDPEVDELEARIDSLKEREAELEAQLRANDTDELEQQVEEKRNDIAELEETVIALRSENDELTRERRALRSKVQELEAEIDELEQELSDGDGADDEDSKNADEHDDTDEDGDDSDEGDEDETDEWTPASVTGEIETEACATILEHEFERITGQPPWGISGIAQNDLDEETYVRIDAWFFDENGIQLDYSRDGSTVRSGTQFTFQLRYTGSAAVETIDEYVLVVENCE